VRPEVATLTFFDADSGEEAVAIVREVPTGIALAVSLQRDGDIEVVLKPSDCEALIAALEKARATAVSPNSEEQQCRRGAGRPPRRPASLLRGDTATYRLVSLVRGEWDL
jgi:hypothetical protein